MEKSTKNLHGQFEQQKLAALAQTMDEDGRIVVKTAKNLYPQPQDPKLAPMASVGSRCGQHFGFLPKVLLVAAPILWAVATNVCWAAGIKIEERGEVQRYAIVVDGDTTASKNATLTLADGNALLENFDSYAIFDVGGEMDKLDAQFSIVGTGSSSLSLSIHNNTAEFVNINGLNPVDGPHSVAGARKTVTFGAGIRSIEVDGSWSTIFGLGSADACKDYSCGMWDVAFPCESCAFGATAYYGAVVFGCGEAESCSNLFSDYSFGNLTSLSLSAAAKNATCFGGAKIGPDSESTFCIWKFDALRNCSIAAAGSDYSATFGCASIENSTASFCDWYVGDGPKVAVFAEKNEMFAKGKAAAVLGCGYANGIDASFCRWFVAPIDDSSLVASGDYASIFGLGAANGTVRSSFSGWALCGFQGVTAAAGGEICATLFGAADISRCVSSFCNWTFGDFLSGNTFTARGRKFSALFGCASAATVSESSFRNWSAEFRGSQTLTAIAGDGSSANGELSAICLGGFTNDSMRFYFNGMDCEGTPTVSIAALKLIKLHFPSEYSDAAAELIVSPGQGNGDTGWGDDAVSTSANVAQKHYGWARALSVGDNFQFNVGRTRIVDDSWNGDTFGSMAVKMAAASGLEIDESIYTGGKVPESANPGILNVIGAIARTTQLANGARRPNGSIMRIDSGWTVNCFGPVKDLCTIDLIDGKLALVDISCDLGKNLFAKASADVGRNMALTNGDKIYRGGPTDGAFRRDGAVSAIFGTYPVAGSLTVGDGDILQFHLNDEIFAQTENFHGQLFAAAASGTIELLGTTSAMLNFEKGCWIGLSRLNPLPGNSMVVIATAPANAPIEVVSGLRFKNESELLMVSDIGDVGFADLKSESFTAGDPSPTHLMQIAGNDINLPDSYLLYWFENDGLRGLALSRHRAPIHAAIAASGMLAREKCYVMNLLQKSTPNDLDGSFISTIASSIERKIAPGNRCTALEEIYGVALGETTLYPMDEDDLLVSVFLGASEGRSSYGGPTVERTMCAKRGDCSVGAVAQHLSVDSKNFRGRSRAALSLCCGRIECQRETEDGNVMKYKFNDYAAQIDAFTSHGFIRVGNVDLGLFGGICCDMVKQNGFHERSTTAKPFDCIQMKPLEHILLAGEIGVVLDNGIDSPLQLHGKFGWQSALARKHSVGSAIIYEMEYEAPVYYGSRDSATASIAVERKLKKDRSFRIDFDGVFAKDWTAFSAKLSLSNWF
ncbi:MAG: hypothetical protein LBI39_02900 [Puniceicoccales bacterium]|jgi:hypothetical protein|nr:hypothetical protein [Puniceicoccales bacterium]